MIAARMSGGSHGSRTDLPDPPDIRAFSRHPCGRGAEPAPGSVAGGGDRPDQLGEVAGTAPHRPVPRRQIDDVEVVELGALVLASTGSLDKRVNAEP